VVHLAGGRVVGRGTHAELLAGDPSYADLVTAYARDAAERAAERAASDTAADTAADTASGATRGARQAAGSAS